MDHAAVYHLGDGLRTDTPQIRQHVSGRIEFADDSADVRIVRQLPDGGGTEPLGSTPSL